MLYNFWFFKWTGFSSPFPVARSYLWRNRDHLICGFLQSRFCGLHPHSPGWHRALSWKLASTSVCLIWGGAFL